MNHDELLYNEPIIRYRKWHGWLLGSFFNHDFKISPLMKDSKYWLYDIKDSILTFDTVKEAKKYAYDYFVKLTKENYKGIKIE